MNDLMFKASKAMNQRKINKKKKQVSLALHSFLEKHGSTVKKDSNRMIEYIRSKESLQYLEELESYLQDKEKSKVVKELLRYHFDI